MDCDMKLIDGVFAYYDFCNVDEYNDLREICNMPRRNREASKIGLVNSEYMICLRLDGRHGKLIGMGRVIGDGGCFYNVVDVAVHPDYQRKGLGSYIMCEIKKFLDYTMPEGSYVNLIADFPADKLYTRFGFEYSYPKSCGMVIRY